MLLVQMQVIQSTVMSLCGRKFEVDMHLIMSTDSTKKIITWQSKKRNALMRNVQGRFHVMDLATAEKILHKTLPAAMSTKDLTTLLNAAAPNEKDPKDASDAFPLAALGSLMESKKCSSSIVLFQQSVLPLLSPPPGFRTLFRKHLASHFEGIVADLQNGALKAGVTI